MGPLKDIRVLDLSRIMAGPWAGQILADLGADVIKVERPGKGDDTRSWGPPFLKDTDGNETPDAGYYLAVNRGKRSIEVELDTEEGQETIRRLAARSDIVLENFKFGTLERYGLDYASLTRVKPDIIYCSITGFGQTGPRRAEPAYDFLIQAMGGLMSVTGEPDGAPGGGPQKVGIPIADIMTGMYAVIAVLAALSNRKQTGKGEYVDIAMLDVQASFLANQAMNYLVSGRPPRRNGNAHPNIQPQDVYPVKDGHVVLVVGNDLQFARLADLLGRPELASDPRFATNAERVRNVKELRPLLSELLGNHPMKDFLEACAKHGVPSGPINTIPMLFEDNQFLARKMMVTQSHPTAGTVRTIASPMKFTKNTLSFDRPPPLLGEHTAELSAEFGLGEATES